MCVAICQKCGVTLPLFQLEITTENLETWAKNGGISGKKGLVALSHWLVVAVHQKNTIKNN